MASVVPLSSKQVLFFTSILVRAEGGWWARENICNARMIFFTSAALRGSVLVCHLLWLGHSGSNLSSPFPFPRWSLASLCHLWIQFLAEAAGVLERSSRGEAGLAVLFPCLPRGGSCWSLGPHFWVYSSTGRCQKFPHSATLHSPMVCVTKSTLPSHGCVFLSFPETNVISNKKCSPTLGPKVGNKILYSAEFKLSFPLLAGLWALSLFMGPRRDLGHRKGPVSQQSLAGQCSYHPAPAFSAKGTKAELPWALLPAFFHLQ